MAPVSSSPRRRHLTIVLLPAFLLILAIVLLATSISAQTDPPATGDWVISDSTVVTNRDITVSGNVSVTGNGRLEIRDSTLSLSISAPRAYRIEVGSGATLVLDGVTIDSTDGASLYNMTISGSSTIQHSFIRRLDGLADIESVAAPQGMVVQTSSFLMNNTTVEDSNGFPILVFPGLTGDIEPVFTNSTIINNGGGIVCVGILFSGNAVIEDCTFYGNTIADVVAVAADPEVYGCTFGGSLFATSTVGVLAFGTAEPSVKECVFSWTLVSAVVSIAASPTVRDCEISWSAMGFNIIGGAPVIERNIIGTTVTPMVLNATSAEVKRCEITTFTTPAYSISIDGGDPTIDQCTVTNSLMGGAISIINGSRAVIYRCTLTGSGATPVIYVEDSQPSVEICTIVGGSDGIELMSSPAYVRNNDIQNNFGWGIVSWFEEFTNTGNDFGTGGDVNVDGRVIQFNSLTVHVELEDGRPAVDATVLLDDALGDPVLEMATDASGFAFSELLVTYEITNGNRTISYSPYMANATLGELVNITLIDISGNPEVVLVLRPVPNLPPIASVTSPVDGYTYNAWEHREGILLEGTAADPDGGPVDVGWVVNGVYVGGEPEPLFLDPGEHSVGLRARDQTGLETWSNVSFSVVSVPPEHFGISIELPTDGAVFQPDEDIAVGAVYNIEEHPYLDVDAVTNISWSSSIDGLLPPEEAQGVLTDLSYGVHLITVTLTPLFPEWVPENYTDSVSIEVLAPEPVAVANISSPVDGSAFVERDTIMLSAEGSYLDIRDPPEHRVVYRWSSDLDGALGEGFELEARYLSLGEHVIRLELTTEPFIVSDNATVTITIEIPPNNGPVARITLVTVDPVAGKPVIISGSGSVDPDGDGLSYHWDLGDGNTSDLMEVNHTYAEGGNYTVVLTVSDGRAEANASLVIEVAPADDGGNGANGGNGNGNGNGDGDPVEPENEGIWGWVLLALLLAMVGMLALALRGRQQRE